MIWPIPAYSRTSLIPATAEDLSGKERETAITVPSGAVILNLKPDSSSLKSSNIPAIGLLPAMAAALASILSRGGNTALGCRPDGLVEAWTRSGTKCEAGHASATKATWKIPYPPVELLPVTRGFGSFQSFPAIEFCVTGSTSPWPKARQAPGREAQRRSSRVSRTGAGGLAERLWRSPPSMAERIAAFWLAMYPR